MHDDVLSIEEAFGDLQDPRSRTPAHRLTEMLTVALCAILSGADSWIGIEVWGLEKLGWQRRHIRLKHGIASHDTFGRVFAGLDPKQFEACFIRWMSQLCPALAGLVVAIDGKTVRGSHQRGQRAVHLASAYGAGLGMVLGQIRTAEKSNEITAIPELLNALLLKAAIVTIDAMGCQREIAQRIVNAGADYVLACKGNQGTMLSRVQRAFEAMERVPQAYADYTSEHREVEKGHGRIETRRCVASDILTRWQQEPDLWPGLHSIVAFSEDQCQVRVNNAAQNFVILRRISMNLLRQDHTTKVGLKSRRLKACANTDYLANSLAGKPLSPSDPSRDAPEYIKHKGSVYAFHKKYSYGLRSLVEAQISRIK